jgi:hypothetical protein
MAWKSMRRTTSIAWDALASLKLTIVCLALLMILLVGCTLAEVRLGTYAAVGTWIRSFAVYCAIPGNAWSVPVLPGGGVVEWC